MKTFVLVLFTVVTGFSQTTDIEIDYRSDLTDYEVLRNQLTGFKVFFDGESHNVSSNETRHFNLFKFLYLNYGVRYFIKEYDFQYGYYLSKYLQTGDTTWIGRGPSQEAREFYKEVHEFNLGLPDTAKIMFLSIDAYAFRDTESFLEKMMKDKPNPPEVVKEAIQILKPIKKTHSKGFGMDIRGKDKNSIMKKLVLVRQIVAENRSAFEEYFQDDYIFFHLIVFNKASELRSEKNLAANFIEFQRLYNSGNYYLYYGNLHCQLKPNWFAGIVDNTPEFKDRVCSFTSQYADSEYWFYDIRKEADFGIINVGNYGKKIIETLRAQSKTDCTLFRAADIDQGLAKGTDYIFLLKNQKAMHSYYKKAD